MYYPGPMYPSPFNQNRHIIEVTGEGTVSAAPDKSTIVLGAVTEDVSLSKAQAENAKILSNIIDALVKLTIPKEHIQTVTYRIDIRFDYEEGKQILKGYQVTHLLQVTIDKIELTGLVVDTAVSQGANSISNIQFISAHPETHYNHALTLAIKNAENKAFTIAKTLGVTLIHNPLQIQEESHAPEPIPYQTGVYVKSAATPIEPGELKISAALKAKYSYF
ncbi:SIMPL domain-containing protein [Paenibacillus sedimenti]|uniref:SIMPL domain-containing protein n=1 Tax=Paenibacillus sedimenti TaxID=2770274 RepID=A0A926KRU5_9BACL|nr:SIMPL domain-containing protein [Paenibacillus sedimenti]MBD0382158.1 SIMPL domain-containing protein [Paenibacillus sedimenti]